MSTPLIKPSHRGLLHKKLGIPQDQTIPETRIKAAENSPSPALRKEAQFADNFGKKASKHARGISVRHAAPAADAPAKPDGYVPGLDDDEGDDYDAAKSSASRGLFKSMRGGY